jgi:hypothetical protein
MMLLYEFVKPKMLLVDDLESHMNPSLLMHVASWFGEVLQEGTKLVISTHSLEVAKFIAGSLEDYGPKIALVTLRGDVMSSRGFSVEEIEELGINSLSSIPKLIESGKTKSLIVSMDQERLTLEEVEASIKRKLRETGVEHELIEEGRRTYVFNCIYACHRFRAAIVVNGLDRPYRRHMIEDHLLEFYREFMKRDLESLLSDVDGDPKEAWKRLKSEEELIYNRLLRASCDELEKTFTQRVRALKLLMS